MGIEDQSQKLQLAPNPATTSFRIVNLSQSGKPVNISLVDMAGQRMLITSTTADTADINCSSLNPGVYIVLMQTGDEIKYSKIVIK